MALVAEDGQEWYAALECPNPGSWVAEHVMPLVGIAPVSRLVFCVSLRQFLKRFATVHIVADWPEDIEHFCEKLIMGPGMRSDTPPLTMEIRRDLDGVLSALPHNALEDARAIRASHLALESAQRRGAEHD